MAHAAGALASWQVGSREEARAAEDAGCDFFIAQGVEAGGHVRALIDARAQDTLYTDVSSAGWPDAPHRVLRACVEAAQAFQGATVGERSAPDGERVSVQRFQPLPINKTVTGAIAAMPH